MKKKVIFGFISLIVIMLQVSCHKSGGTCDAPIIGHWGCEKYISHRSDSLGFDKWDTIMYEVGPGCAYELFFYNTGKGLLKLNDSPAFIKEFSCDYEFDSVSQQVIIKSSSWLYGLYGSLFLDEDKAVFDLEFLTDSTWMASWYNRVSEPVPFYEWFYLKRID